MRVLVVPDSFKESLSAAQAAEAIARGWQTAAPEDTLQCIPFADGGEGTLDVVLQARKGIRKTATVQDPLGRPIEAHWGLIDNGTKAIIEMAQASGLEHLSPEERNPRITSTYGTGELMVTAMEAGARDIVVTLGGSATNDGGTGMATALGYSFQDEHGQPLPQGGQALQQLARIDSVNCHPLLPYCTIQGACDVGNPLYGEQGATAVYAPQKGATLEDIDELDQALIQLNACIQRDLDKDIAHVPGAGAAGGLGAGILAFCNGTLVSGFELMAKLTNLSHAIQLADLVITGEGCVDEQSIQGKVTGSIGKLAQTSGTPVVALAGALGEGHEALYAYGFSEFHALEDGATARDTLLAEAAPRLEALAGQVARQWHEDNQS